MTATSADDYLKAADAAYHFQGNIEALNAVLDSQNHMADSAAVSLQDMADATAASASAAAQYGVEIDELSALIATVAANTESSGAEVGNALKIYLMLCRIRQAELPLIRSVLSVFP